jgi:phosphate butyryltransferase
MIRDFNDIDALASTNTPMGLVALAAADREFLLTIKKACELGYIHPCIIGDSKKLRRTAESIEFDLSNVTIIEEKEPQAIADKGIEMLFSKNAYIPMKGHIPTAYVYRAIIRKERSMGGKDTISVNTLWDIPGVSHLVSITDTGVSIRPDYETKKHILSDAVALMHLLGYHRPQVAVLSAYNGFTDMTDSFVDAGKLQKEALGGSFGACDVIRQTSLADILAGEKECFYEFDQADLEKTPHVLVTPHLDAGNILSKLDFILDVTRRSLVMTSMGPVIIPSRSDTHNLVVGEVALGVVVARLLGEKS